MASYSPPTIGKGRRAFNLGGATIFGGARYSPERSTVIVPTLDTRREVDAMSRMELLKASRAFTRNIAAVKRIWLGAPVLAFGQGLKPFPLTTDTEWNKRALAYFMNRSASRDVFDLGGKWNYFDAQKGLLAGRLRDGDLFSVLTKSETGRARFGFFEGHQVGNIRKPWGRAVEADEKFIDGVRVDKHNRAIAYRFLGDNDKTQILPRESVIAYMDHESRGENRGAPACSHWINDGIDRSDIIGYFKSAMKSAATQGFYQYNAGGDEKRLPKMGRPPQTQKLSDGTEITVAEVFQGGQVANLGDSRLAVLNDDRPHPNASNFLDDRLRDLALGVGIPAEVIFYLSGLRGAEVRLSLVGADCWIKDRQQHLIDRFCNRVWAYTIATAMNVGDLPRCSDPMWWKVGHIAPSKITVDIGRDGGLALKQYKERLITHAQWAGERGTHWEDQQDQSLLEDARGAKRQKEIAQEWGVTIDEMVAFRDGTAPIPTGDA